MEQQEGGLGDEREEELEKEPQHGGRSSGRGECGRSQGTGGRRGAWRRGTARGGRSEARGGAQAQARGGGYWEEGTELGDGVRLRAVEWPAEGRGEVEDELAWACGPVVVEVSRGRERSTR